MANGASQLRRMAGRVRRTLLPVSLARFRMPRLSAAHAGAVALIKERAGLEIGGPSTVFSRRGLFPIYPHAARVDNCNYRNDTVWEGRIEGGDTFLYDRRREAGRQFFAEAAALTFADSSTYDFVLSSHTLEHSANPLKCLHEWQRVLKPGGAVVLVLPHKDGTFDHWRPVTPLQHLIEDFERQTGEDDLTHLSEILALHDLTLDPEAGTQEHFEARSRANFENRCLHQHVFDTQRAIELVDNAGLQIQSVAPVAPVHILLVAVKTAQRNLDNGRFLCHGAAHRRRSPFVSDRLPHGLRH